MSDAKKFSCIAYLGPLWIFSHAANKKKRDAIVTYHCNQGLMLFIVEMITLAGYIALRFIPDFGELLAAFFGLIAFPVCALYSAVGIINVLNNRLKPLPYIGGIKLIH